MCENPHVDINRPAVAELMADVSAALARRVNALCEDICEVTLRSLPTPPRIPAMISSRRSLGNEQSAYWSSLLAKYADLGCTGPTRS